MTIWGWDVSHFDAPDTRQAVAEDFSFFTHKAGGDANDAELNAWWVAMKPYRDQVLLGAYWVLYPDNPVARADAFLARLDTQCPGWRDGPFILQADCEKWNNSVLTVPSKMEIEFFCDRLVERMPKLKPIVYAPRWVYGEKLAGLPYPLWASAYVTGTGTASELYPGDGSSKWAAYSGQVPAVLQFTSSATIAGQTTCDANAYRGTLPELTALLAPGWVQEEAEMTPDEIQAVAKAVWSYPIPAPDNVGTWTAGGYQRNDYVESKNARLQADKILPLIQELAGRPAEDINALAAAIAALLPEPASTPVDAASLAVAFRTLFTAAQ
jgi:hypothetical protein